VPKANDIKHVFVFKIEHLNIRVFKYSNNLRYSNNTIKIRILFLYSNIRLQP